MTADRNLFFFFHSSDLPVKPDEIQDQASEDRQHYGYHHIASSITSHESVEIILVLCMNDGGEDHGK